MDWNEHAAVFMARERLAEARADAERRALRPGRDRRRLRRRLGAPLVHLGQRLAGEAVGVRPLPCGETFRG